MRTHRGGLHKIGFRFFDESVTDFTVFMLFKMHILLAGLALYLSTKLVNGAVD